MEIEKYLKRKRIEIEKALAHYIPEPFPPFANHLEAVRYSLLAGGKRIRPVLCLAAAEATTSDRRILDSLLPIACALECIHTYSLIHDDLPAMDNDVLRRGKPTNHVIYGEAAAILAGDGLLTYAFQLLATPAGDALLPGQQLNIIQVIAEASGSLGMVGGQALDMQYEKTDFPFETLQTIHKNKTGALITASILAGAIGANASEEQKNSLFNYGEQIGLAFQIIDDLLNATATTKQLGKTAGNDLDKGKATYVAYFGVGETRKRAAEATDRAKQAIENFGLRAEPLRALADYLKTRTH